MEGQACPDFTLPATSDTTFALKEAAKPLVIYFYPKDNTPGCTNESMAFRDLYPQFQAASATVVGISRDSVKSHENFKAKLELPFELLSDKEETACALFDVMKMKNMYGKQVRGVERSTFVINADGIISRAWRGVKVPGHAEEVLAYVQSL
jgi:peroxiredoxin Q/BCP